ncbi:phosphate/phosphite/phosphonate ABC transporter substrate-binding protein [Pelobacter seleniigenes]|uniref:phosphate/phosphite/phosphonate ABC transporter substrate-binding protein n=1 Tax=Pelobacter seleniigenes TaxID=407188 RepID=UPI00068C7B46|nr:phosphate/phosphite/phosphonate ABC transporter substrate-binding protein [Pelobacter seleniigenes]
MEGFNLSTAGKKLFGALFTLFLVLHTTAAAGKGPLTLGIHPFQSARILQRQFSPLVEYLSLRLDHPVELRIGSSYREHVESVGRDLVDIAYLGPLGYIEMVDRYGPKPLIAGQETNGSPISNSVIFTRINSGIASLTALEGQPFAFVNRHSTMGYLLPAFVLSQHNPTLLTQHRYQFLNTHENVVLGVLSGDFIAGAVKETVFNNYKQHGLKELARSPASAEHLFVARNGLSRAELGALRRAFFDLRSLPEGTVIMQAITPTISAFVPIKDSAYNPLRQVLHNLAEKGLLDE